MNQPPISRPLRIAYVTTYDSRDVRQWSGAGFHIAKALERQGQHVIRIGPLETLTTWIMRQKQWMQRHLHGRHHPLERESAVLDHFAAQVLLHLSSVQADVVVSPGIIPIAHLDVKLPLVSWTDATFAGVADTYPEFTQWSADAIAQAHASERASFSRNALSLYTSQWAANTAIHSYNADPAKVKVVPFGANIECSLTDEELESRIAERQSGPLRLLFVGVDWLRKGGPQTLEALRHLRTIGKEAHLCVIGCQPEIPDDLRAVVEVLGFVSKHDAAGRARLDEQFRRATFLVLLSAHECFGLVLCEACAHGLPSLTTTSDGIPTIIQDGVNGLAKPFGTAPEILAEQLLATMQEPGGYAALCRQALAAYRRDFNWDVAGKRVVDLLQELVEPTPRAD